jgi:soluble lytic murein transglycosylase-like protein
MKKLEPTSSPLVQAGPSEGRSELVPRERREMFYLVSPRSRAHTTALWLMSAALVLLLGAVGFLLYQTKERDGIAAGNIERFERQVQRLDAGISPESRRQRLALAARDQILLANPKLGLEEAYRYAELLLEATQASASVSPLLLLSMGTVGSGYDPRAIGSDDGRGLYQIRPTQGRMLVRSLKWEFREEMLLDPEVNTRLAVLLLDVLFTEHGDRKLVLADYYGGAQSAGLLAQSEEDVPPETRLRIHQVSSLYEDLETRLADAVEAPISTAAQ